MRTKHDRHQRFYREAAERYKRKLARSGEVILCHVCGREIDMSLTNHHSPHYFTVDHLTPLSRGGDLMDISGWAPAHKGCNSRRGSSVTYEHVRVNASREW